jgi:phage gp45-like
MMIRGILQSFSGAAHKIARFTASGLPGELIENREAMQHYGFASRPKSGAEGVVVHKGNHFLLIAEDDRRYRIALTEGEVALYTDEGDSIHLKRGNKIEINAIGEVTISAPKVTLGSSAQLLMASGVVTGMCSCAVTGAPHPVTSQTVKATL